MECVVGNCVSPKDNVKRCYWAKDVGEMSGNLELHAYLDLCGFHQISLKSCRRMVEMQGWDA